MTRRQALGTTLLVPAAAAATPPPVNAAKIETLDKAIDSSIERQITDKNHKYRGLFVADDGLYYAGTCAGMMDGFLTALLSPQSRHHKSARVAERLQLTAECFGRMQTRDGNWNLPLTNFNSPPDTAFILQGLSLTLMNARQYGFPDLEQWLLPTIQRAGDGLAKGGMHTPNHRWVATSALSGLYKLYGEAKYLKRAEQWLAEGIDIDSDGQYTERSSITYNAISNRALTFIAEWLGRPEYLAPVRRNLAAMLYLLHADGEVVTEISRRQDLNLRGTLYYHWFPLSYLAWKDQNGQLATLARQLEPAYGPVSYAMRWPELWTGLPANEPLPDNFEKIFPIIGLARIRRGPKSIGILRDRDRFFTFRHGGAVVTAVRIASAFFGKGQFRAQTMSRNGNEFVLTQKVDAGYYQPFSPPRLITTETYDATREQRQRTEICELHSKAVIAETPTGASLTIEIVGTDEVPVTVEINLREGAVINGAEKIGKFKDAWLLRSGYAEYALGGDTLKIGPGRAEHTYLEVRGALPRLEGPSLFITGLTPFRHTLTFSR